MSIPSWPSSLGHLVRSGTWSLSPITELAASPFEQGPGRTRRQFTNLRYSARLTIVMTRQEFRVFKGFVFGTLQHGALRFTMSCWDGEEYNTVTAKLDPEQLYTANDVFFELTAVSLSLEIFDLPVLDAGAMEFLSQFDETDAIAWPASLHTWVNTTYPAAVAPYA